MKSILFCLPIVLIACNGLHPKNTVSFDNHTMTIKGELSDSILNDTIRYYDLTYGLIASTAPKEGTGEQTTTSYYPNGTLRETRQLSHHLWNGDHAYYDSLGRCFYQDFYYYNLPVGPVVYWATDGRPKRYYFVSLQNETLMDIDYREWHGIDSFQRQLINYTCDFQKKDSIQEITLFLYLLHPPKLSVDYSLFKKKPVSLKDTAGEQMLIRLQPITSQWPFLLLTVPILPAGEQYSVGATVYDSLLDKKTTVFSDVVLPVYQKRVSH